MRLRRLVLHNGNFRLGRQKGSVKYFFNFRKILRKLIRGDRYPYRRLVEISLYEKGGILVGKI